MFDEPKHLFKQISQLKTIANHVFDVDLRIDIMVAHWQQNKTG